MKNPVIKEVMAQRRKEEKISERAQRNKAESRFYNLNSILGNDWAMFYVLLGSRMTGKSYAITDYICRQKKKYGDDVKAYWLRISDTSIKAMLANKADKLVDPDLKRKYGLEFTTKAGDVFYERDGQKAHFMTCAPLCSFAKLKGVGYYDKDFKGRYIIVLDEFQLEQGERRTSFDVLYNFIGMLENIARTTKNNIQVFIVGNTLQEASGILKAFNFIPQKFGRYYLKKKRCVIDYMENSAAYFEDRKGSLADILGGDAMSNYTNQIEKDIALIYKGKLARPTAIIQFGKGAELWYTLWDGKIIKRYNGEKLPEASFFPMKPYLGKVYTKERRQTILDMYDSNQFLYKDLITKTYFEDELIKIRKT